MRILVVDDEIDLAEAVATGLRREGYAVDVSSGGADAIERLRWQPYDLVCLDLTMPDVDGLDVCRQLRTNPPEGGSPRILMLTARDAVEDRILGLDSGADDYLIKPFAFGELAARVRVLLRRDRDHESSVLVVGRLELDTARHEAAVDGAALDLTPKEFALLRYFMTHSSHVLSQERLLEHVWDENADPFTNTVRVTVGTLRRKLADRGGDGLIETVIGRGYRLTGEDDS
jgi:DNA-binding response OmpR family regulator